MTWANQVRVLKQQFQALGAVVGQGLIQALKPALIAMNNFLSKVIDFAKKIFNALGKIFGWELDVSAGALDNDLGGAEEMADGLGDSLGGVGDAADGASEKVKELNKQLQGFDKLNVLTTTEKGSGTGGSGGSGGGGSGGSGGGGGAGSANDVTASIKKTKGLFESEIDNLFELGEYISKTLQRAMDNIDWNSIYQKARGFGTGLAQFLNGLFSGDPEHNVFASLGRTVAGAINTALNFFDSFAEEFDFSTFGTNLASFFVETVENIDWTMAGQAFHKWMQGIKDAFTSFVSYLWENKDEVFKAIKDFLSEITIEDIAIFIGIMTISKIGKWVLAEGVFKLAGEAIGALFKNVSIAITAKITGLSFAEASALGAKGLIGELIGTNGLITNALGLALLEGTGAATVGGALATFALPIAFAITPLIFHKVLKNMYEDAKEEGDTVKQGIIENAFGKKASISKRRTEDGEVYDVELGAVINWKLLFGKITDKLPWKDKGFFKWLGEKMFPKTVGVEGDEVTVNYDTQVELKVNLDWIKGKWKTLLDWLKEKWKDIRGGLSSNKWAETTQAITAQFKISLEWIKNKWTTFKDWVKENLFGKKDTGTTDIGTRKVSIGLKLETAFSNFNDWLRNALGIKDGKSNATANLTGKFINWSQVAGGGALSGVWSYVKGFFNQWNKPNGGGNGVFSGAWSYVKAFFNAWNKPNGSGNGIFSGAWSYAKAYFNQWNKPRGSGNGIFSGAWSYAKAWFNDWNRPRGGGNGIFSGAWSYAKAWFNDWNSPRGSGGGVFGGAWSYVKGYFNDWYSPRGGGGGVFANAWSYVKGFFKSNATGGILTAAGWKPIQGYASGGIVDSAQIFMARENGLPEMVGTIGGHTAVMNNDQIVASVANGVAQANSAQNELLRQQNALLRQILAKETGISSRDIFDAVRSENRNYTNRTGKSAFSY